MNRPSTEAERLTLKAALRRLLKAAGGQESAQQITRGAHQTLNRYANPNEPDCHVPVDVVLDLERDTGEPILTRLLADLAGYELVPKAAAAVGEAERLTGHLADVAGAAGQTISALGEALADGSLDAAERARLKAASVQTRRELAELEHDLERGEPPTPPAGTVRMVPRRAGGR